MNNDHSNCNNVSKSHFAITSDIRTTALQRFTVNCHIDPHEAEIAKLNMGDNFLLFNIYFLK